MLNLDKINNDVSLPISIEFNVNRVMGAAAKYRNIAFDEASNTYKNSTLYKSQTSSLAYRIGIYYNLD